MKTYPSIGTEFDPRTVYHLFDKLDGSNIRAEWSPKRGFYKFGTRTQLLTSEQTTLLPAIDRIRDGFEATLGERFARKKWERAVAFFEFAGPTSFAGSHPDPAALTRVSLIDVAVYKKGLLAPEQLLDLGEGLPMPAMLYHGRITPELVQSVRDSTLPGITFEGVVGKGPFSQKEGGPVQFKIKTLAWLHRLKAFCKDDEQLFERLK